MLQQINSMDSVGAGMERPKKNEYTTVSLAQWATLYNVAHCTAQLDEMKAIIAPLSRRAKKLVRAKVAEEHQDFLTRDYTPFYFPHWQQNEVNALKFFFKRYNVTFQYKAVKTAREILEEIKMEW